MNRKKWMPILAEPPDFFILINQVWLLQDLFPLLEQNNTKHLLKMSKILQNCSIAAISHLWLGSYTDIDMAVIGYSD